LALRGHNVGDKLLSAGIFLDAARGDVGISLGNQAAKFLGLGLERVQRIERGADNGFRLL